MKKKILLTLTTVFISLFALGLTASAETYGDLTYKVTNGKVTIAGCDRSATSVTIPNTIEGYPVTSIGSSAFYKCSRLTSIDLPDSVTSIGYRAFSWCESLTSIDLPDSVTSIGEDAFYYCSRLTSIELPDSVTSIGDFAFYNCSSLTSIDLLDGVKSIGGWAFYNCSSLTSIELPDSVTSIGSSAFEYCSSLTSIELPDSVTSIGECAFSGCESLTSIDIPDSVTSIGDYAFYGCRSLKTVYYYGTEEDWNEINIGDGNEPLTQNVIFIPAYTQTELLDKTPQYDIYSVTPVNVSVGNTIIFASYAGNKMICVESREYTGKKIEYFVEKNNYNKIKVFVWEGLENLKPITIAEIVK